MYVLFVTFKFTVTHLNIHKFIGKQKKLNRNLLCTAASAVVQSTSTTNCLKITQSVTKYPETMAEKESGNVTNVIENDTGTRQSAADDE